MRLNAVVVTYNASTWIEGCLDSLLAAGVGKTVVVDNGSHDRISNRIQKHLSSVRLLLQNQNHGFGVATNIGIQAALDAGADLILLANQDIVVEPDALERLLDAASRRREYGMLSAFQLTYDGSSVDPLFRHYLPPQFLDDLFFEGSPQRDVYEADFVPAACVLIRREVLIRVGGFDPLFFMYAEDNDLCERVKRAGWKLGIVPRAVVHHAHGVLNRQQAFASSVNSVYSKAVLAIKHSDQRSTLLAAMIVWLRMLHLPRPSRKYIRSAFAHIYACLRCFGRIGAIHRNRNGIPHRFEDRRAQVSQQAVRSPKEAR